MKVIIGWAVVAAATPLLPALAQENGPGPLPKWASRVLEADSDGDRNVTYTELRSWLPEASLAQFARLDRNGNGMIDPSDRPGRPPSPRQRRRHVTLLLNALAKLRETDANGDGHVTYEEVSAAKPGYPRCNFQAADVNHDGVLSSADVEGIQRILNHLDAPPGNGRRPENQGERRANLMRRILQADADGDGRVTFAEAQAQVPKLKRPAFERLDRNGDGLISQADRSSERPNPGPQ